MATLSDVVTSLKDINTTLEAPPKKSASDVEREMEAANDAKRGREIQENILSELKRGIGGVTGADKQKGGLISGLLGGLGAGIMGVIRAVSKIGPKFILGMGSLGAGIVAFMVALGGGAAIATYAGLDGEGLKTLVGNTFGAFSGTDLVAMAAIIGAAMGMERFKISKVGVALGMGAIGAGIAAFTLGILLADGFSSLGALIGLDGGSLKTLMSNFFGAFDGPGQIKGLVTLLTAGALAGAIPGGEVAVVKGMTAIGAGIAAFTIGLLVGEGFAMIGKMLGLDGSNLKVLLGNLGEGIGNFIGGIGKGTFEQLKDIDAEKLVQLGKGIAGVGVGIAAFGAGAVLGVVGGVMEGLGSFFGVKSPIDRIIEISQDKSIDTKRLKELGEGLGPLGQGIAAFGGFELKGGFFGGDTDIEQFIKVIQKIGASDANIDAVQIATIASGIEPLGKAMSGFKGIDFANLDDIDDFFDGISYRNLQRAATPEQLKEVSKGIAPLAEAMKSFKGIDMDAITGGVGEDNLGKFFEGMGVAAKEIKDPNTLVKAAIGVKALGEAMQSFKGIDGDQINTALEAVVEAGGSDKAIQIFTGSAQAAGAGGGGDTFVTNNYYTDNSVKSSSNMNLNESVPTRSGESTQQLVKEASKSN
tara:strand:- start:103 stop:2028 length:1926 start_codon:yes stop_codon:yes gene_type:complete